MFKLPFWRGAIERALKTAAQTFAGSLVIDGADILSMDWRTTLALVATTTALSLLTSVASSRLGPEQTHGSASLVDDVSE